MLRIFYRCCLFFILFGSSLNCRAEGFDLVKNINATNGLSSNVVYTSLLDHQGFIWFGTEEGLTRFDGHSFKVYPSDNMQEASIPYDIVKRLFEDSKGRIWVGTERGLAYLSNPDRRVVRLLGDVSTLRISAIEELRNGAIWVTTPKGVYEITDDQDAARLVSLRRYGLKNGVALSNIVQDKDGYLWALDVDGGVFSNRKGDAEFSFRANKKYTSLGKLDEGRYIYLVGRNNVDFFDVKRGRASSLKLQSRIMGAYLLSKDQLLIVMTSGEVALYSISKGASTLVPLRLSNMFITGAASPIPGVLSFSTLESGVLMYAENKPLFDVVNPLGEQNGEYQIFKSMVKMRDGRIAACAWNHGVVILSGDLKVVRTYPISSVFDGYNAQSITEFIPGNLMVGTVGGGVRFIGNVNISDKVRGLLGVLQNDNVWTLVASQYKRGIWIGTQQVGLLRFDPLKEQVDRRFGATFRNMDVRAIMEVDSTKLLVGSLNRGIYLVNPTTSYVYKIGSDSRLGSVGVYCFYRDARQSNIVWVGTYGSGLLKLNVATLRVERAYTVKDGLPSNVVKSIQADTRGLLWLGTAKGLSKFSPATGESFSFGTDGKMPQHIFSFGSSIRTSDGSIVFGTANGLIRFRPQQLREVLQSALPIVYAVKADGKEIAAYRQGSDAAPLKIPYVDNTVSIEFGGIAYNVQQKSNFFYKLEGVDTEWKRSDNLQNDVTYSNLRSGTYTFRVRNAIYGKEDGANETVVRFRIGYPFWGSPGMISFYVLVVMTVLFFYKRYVDYRKASEAERVKSKYELYVAQQMYRMRLKFFANISHEFRTPLTLILGPIQSLMDEKSMTSERKLAMYHRISRNAKRMLNLVSQIADYRKLEEDQTSIAVELLDVASLARQTVDLFLDQVEQKQQQLVLETEAPLLEGWVDRDKFEKILVNLLSNAVKYSEEHDSIRVLLRKEQIADEDWLVLEVADSGIGIAQENVGKVFDDFFRESSDEGGTGIGLAYTKRLVELHKGAISIVSELGEGTTVSVRLPVSAKAYSEQERYGAGSYVRKEHTSMLPFEKEAPEVSTSAEPKKWKILVVDDDAEICKYVAEIFEDHCEVMTASDGQVGLRKATSFLPSLIISDILMPKMNGLDLLKKLKDNERTAHIPVMLLSARADSSSIKQGLALGADAYLSKPFDEDQLKFNVLNLLTTQDRLLSSVSPAGTNVNVELLSAVDRRFFKKVVGAVERNIDNYEYDIDDLCIDIGVSRTQLYRKMKVVTGVSANEFIRNYRLKKAARLLGNPNMNVGDVLFAVGFNNRSYFNRCFKEYFGMTPMEYVERFCKGAVSDSQQSVD